MDVARLKIAGIVSASEGAVPTSKHSCTRQSGSTAKTTVKHSDFLLGEKY